MHIITIKHTNSHNFIVTVDCVDVPLSYRSFGGRNAVDAIGEAGLAALIDDAEKAITTGDFSTGCKELFKVVGVSNAMELLNICCKEVFCIFWSALLYQRKLHGQGCSFRSMISAVSGTKATLAQNSTPFVEELRRICCEAQQIEVQPGSVLRSEAETENGNIYVSFCHQDNNSLVFAVNGQKVSLCIRQVGDIKTSEDVLSAAIALREAIYSRGNIQLYTTRWGGSFVFRILHVVCLEDTVSYFKDYAVKQMERRILVDPRKTLKNLQFPFNDRSLSLFCHRILSVLERQRSIAGRTLSSGNNNAICSSNGSWKLYYEKNLATHYRNIDFESIKQPNLRKEAMCFLKAVSLSNGELPVLQIARYFYLLRSGLNVIGNTSVTSIKDVTLSQARYVKSHLDRTCHCSVNHISEVLQVLGRMYCWALPECTEYENPFWRVAIPNKGAFLQTTIPADNITLRLVADHLDELPDYVQLGHQLLLLTGARAYDVFHIRVSDLEFSEDCSGYIRFRSSKNSRRMRFQLSAPIVVRLKEYIKNTEALREHSCVDYLLLYEPNGRRSNSVYNPVLLSYGTYNYYINNLTMRYAPDLTLTTRKIRAEVGRRYHSEGLSSSQVAIALGNSPIVAKRHYRTLSPRDEANLFHSRYVTYFSATNRLASESVDVHTMWGSCNSNTCQFNSHCRACPYLYTSEVNDYV